MPSDDLTKGPRYERLQRLGLKPAAEPPQGEVPPPGYCLLCCHENGEHDEVCSHGVSQRDIHGLCPGAPIEEGATCKHCNMSWQTLQRLSRLLSRQQPRICANCGGDSFVCENHLDKPQGHDGCGGAGEPCPQCNPAAEYGRGYRDGLRDARQQPPQGEESHRLRRLLRDAEEVIGTLEHHGFPLQAQVVWALIARLRQQPSEPHEKQRLMDFAELVHEETRRSSRSSFVAAWAGRILPAENPLRSNHALAQQKDPHAEQHPSEPHPDAEAVREWLQKLSALQPPQIWWFNGDVRMAAKALEMLGGE